MVDIYERVPCFPQIPQPFFGGIMANGKMDIGKAVKFYRMREHLNITELAKRSGVSRPNLTLLERGVEQYAHPNTRTLQRLAASLGIGAWVILKRAEGDMNGRRRRVNGKKRR